MLFALWLPWFDRRISGVFSPLEVEQTLSGWKAMGWLGALLLGLALMAVTWAGLIRRTNVSPLWLVLAGGVSLMVVMAVTVDQVGGHDTTCCEPVTTTTAPSVGLAVAYAAALAIILAGLVVLVQEARRRSREV